MASILTIIMKIKFILPYLILAILFSGCAIKYKSTNTVKLIQKNQNNINNNTLNEVAISKHNDSIILFANQQIKKQLIKKGYKSYFVTVENNTRNALKITDKSLYAIRNYEPIIYIKEKEVIKNITFNKGLFFTAGGLGLISPFGFAGGKFIFGARQLYIAIPLFVYGIVNAAITINSKKKLKKDLQTYYLLGKEVPPFSTVTGMIVIKTVDDNFEFTYKTQP